jgi:hypothetical protein
LNGVADLLFTTSLKFDGEFCAPIVYSTWL